MVKQILGCGTILDSLINHLFRKHFQRATGIYEAYDKHDKPWDLCETDEGSKDMHVRPVLKS